MGRIFYVSSMHGDDTNSGQTPEDAFRSLRKINQLEIQPGDQIFWNGDLYLSGSICTCMQGEPRRHRLS